MAVYKDKNTGKWNFRVWVTDPVTGERVQRQRNGFELKRDAIEAEAKLKTDYLNKETSLSDITFDELVRDYLIFQKKRVKRTTYVNYIYMINKYILPTFTRTKVNDISRVQLENWYRDIDNIKYSNGYKNKILTRLKNIFEYSEDQYDIRIRFLNTFPPYTMTKEIETPEKVIYDVKTFNKFISHANNILESSLFYTLFYTGARIGEIRAITWNDVFLNDNYIRINKQVTTKIPGAGPTITTPKTKSSIRNIKIPNILVDKLSEWKQDRMRQKGFESTWQVFGDKGFITENRVRRMVKNISDRAGTPYITLHEFRHSYTTMLYDMKVDPKIMQEQAGHSSINVTLDIYTHLEEEKTKKTIINLFEKHEKKSDE